ncbi:Peptidyl-prolyl cis-trans isomerase-like [Quillaja saponaria]|uniref:Peptidyl-prolyl cis-trans isomerase-like n=1 Tax=Quillaja saponaria TaxID=32244 RepID=A0AAD7L8B3_QUISA|nr:Peptidyl-prolyl cis-trans isomerase-like [Quillaja saponaria]
MGRKHNDPERTRYNSLILLLVCLISCGLIYALLSAVLGTGDTSSVSKFESLTLFEDDEKGGVGANFGGVKTGCCNGIENLELWGTAVKWGSEFKFNSSEECCKACKSMCSGSDGPCLCDSWVFCGNRKTCGSKFGEENDRLYELLFKFVKCIIRLSAQSGVQSFVQCWLKKQKDNLAPDRQEAGQTDSWTSGLIFGRGVGIIGLETEYGTLHIKLFPDCAPHSVAYILQLLGLRHCAGCQFYRAESRGYLWDSEGKHIKNSPFGPPFALVQGTLEAQGTTFKEIPTEVCPTIRRGSVAWIGYGPEFFISLANHGEWKKTYTVFGSVLAEDMNIAERIAKLPTKSDVWNNINVSVLEKPVPLLLRRLKMTHENVNAGAKSD